MTGYEPLDTLKPVADDIRVIDGPATCGFMRRRGCLPG